YDTNAVGDPTATRYWWAPSRTLTAFEQSKLTYYLDNKGCILWAGGGIREDRIDGNLTDAFYNDYLGSNAVSVTASGGGEWSYDVTWGLFDTNGELRDIRYAYVMANKLDGALKEAITFKSFPTLSCDMCSAYTGAVNEYEWGKNDRGDDIANYAGVSFDKPAEGAKIAYLSLLSLYSIIYAGVISGDYWRYITPVVSSMVNWRAPVPINITGTVTLGGTAVANATVLVYAQGDRNGTIKGAGISDGAGNYRVKLWYKGNYDVVAYAPDKGYAYTSVSITAFGNTTWDAALSGNVGKIKGTIYIQDAIYKLFRGGLLVYATSDALKVNKTVIVNLNGYYQINDLPAGTYTVVAHGNVWLNATMTYDLTSTSSASVSV
ncbi:MAG: carboxypeptidase-like regulatory domain-containing protein, partial [Candidatus Thermoplasmatota archaeon]